MRPGPRATTSRGRASPLKDLTSQFPTGDRTLDAADPCLSMNTLDSEARSSSPAQTTRRNEMKGQPVNGEWLLPKSLEAVDV